MIISRTPFRVSFFGGGTDFPEFYSEQGGAVLATTINQFCYITVHRLAPFFEHRFKASYARTETVLNPSEFQHPLIRECLLFLKIKEGLEIGHVSDLPGRTGLGTSSSFTVGLLNALHALKGDRITAEDLAREAIIVERDRVKDSGGHQDQYAAAYGGLMRLDFGNGKPVGVKKIPLTSSRIRALEKRLLMFYTGVEQSAETILAAQKNRTQQNTRVLLEMKEMVTTGERILARSSDLDDFGRLLNDAWMLKKTLSHKISNSSIDEAYSSAQRAGALGGKLLGAGGRGFLLVYAAPKNHARIRKSLKKLREVPFSFSFEGSTIIFSS
jgi:D-glycero-alpha-D-manno-heptose-7-phosphate kinase